MTSTKMISNYNYSLILIILRFFLVIFTTLTAKWYGKMLRLIFIISAFFCFSMNEISGQVFIETYEKLIHHISDTVYSVTSTDNTIYRGIENKIVMRGDLFPTQSLQVIADSALISREGNSYMLVIPPVNSQNDLRIKIKDASEHTLYEKRFRVSNLPVLCVYAGHTNISLSHQMSKNEMLYADSIYVFFGNSIAGNSEWLKINKFSIGYSYGSYYISRENKGNLVSPMIKQILYNLKPGQVVTLKILTEGTGLIKMEVPLIDFKIR